VTRRQPIGSGGGIKQIETKTARLAPLTGADSSRSIHERKPVMLDATYIKSWPNGSASQRRVSFRVKSSNTAVIRPAAPSP